MSRLTLLFLSFLFGCQGGERQPPEEASPPLATPDQTTTGAAETEPPRAEERGVDYFVGFFTTMVDVARQRAQRAQFEQDFYSVHDMQDPPHPAILQEYRQIVANLNSLGITQIKRFRGLTPTEVRQIIENRRFVEELYKQGRRSVGLQSLIFVGYARHDYNSAFLSINRELIRLMCQPDRRFRVVYYELPDEEAYRHAIAVCENVQHISTVILGGHGQRLGIRLGDGGLEEDFLDVLDTADMSGRITEWDFFGSVDNPTQLLEKLRDLHFLDQDGFVTEDFDDAVRDGTALPSNFAAGQVRDILERLRIASGLHRFSPDTIILDSCFTGRGQGSDDYSSRRFLQSLDNNFIAWMGNLHRDRDITLFGSFDAVRDIELTFNGITIGANFYCGDEHRSCPSIFVFRHPYSLIDQLLSEEEEEEEGDLTSG